MNNLLNLIPSWIKPVAIVIVLSTLLYGIFYAGQSNIQAKWDKQVQVNKLDEAQKEGKSNVVKTETKIVYRDRIKEVEVVRDQIQPTIDRYRDTNNSSNFRLDYFYVGMLDSAAENVLPAARQDTDGTPSEVTIADATKVIVNNYGTCNKYIAQINGLLDFIEAQDKIYNK